MIIPGGRIEHGSAIAWPWYKNYQVKEKELFKNCTNVIQILTESFRLRINGFNAARISTVQGLTQAGVQIVVIEDVTVVNWHWPQRARIAPSKN